MPEDGATVNAIGEIPGLRGPVLDQVYAHVFSNADREVGGVLVGQTSPEHSVPRVTAAIAAASAGEQRTTLTFTQDTWEHVHRVLERDHPGQQIVGWYHSHPGFGIFLSDDDMFIHRNFFSGASQIALVVDPLKGYEGVFGWQGGDITPWYERATARPGLGEPSPRLDTSAIIPSAGVGPPEPVTVVLKPRALPTPSNTRSLYLASALVVGVLLGVLLWEGVLRDRGVTDSPEPNRTSIPSPRAPSAVPNQSASPGERGPQ